MAITFSSSGHTLHIVLSTLPTNQGSKFIKEIEDVFYKKFKEQRELNSKPTDTPILNILYKPLKFYLFGNYDIAFISLVDSYKFSQRLFAPKIDSDLLSATYQTITGICPNISEFFKIDEYFERIARAESEYPFLCVCNLKLNNKMLIGNGVEYFKKVLEYIDKKIREYYPDEIDANTEIPMNYFLLQTFSWFEISLIIFAKSIESFTPVIIDLRETSSVDILKEENAAYCKKSAYSGALKDEKEIEKITPHVFADTQSYFGVSCSIIEGDGQVKYKEAIPHPKTHIEWQVKPGHLPYLKEELKKLEEKGIPIFKRTASDDLEPLFMSGKTDYYIEETTNSLENNFRLFRELQKDDSMIYAYARKVKTKIFFENADEEERDFKRTSIKITNRFSTYLNGFSIRDIGEINRRLKALKISRQVREKVIKIFHGYNWGIQDSILFTFFLDFKTFVDRLKNEIYEAYNNFHILFNDKLEMDQIREYKPNSVNTLEEKLNLKINEFEEGYRVRLLNAYYYEDISDFSIDFNSSVQQLLTIYSSIVQQIGDQFKNDYVCPIIQISLSETVSDRNSVNYHVYHLTSPEFVLFNLMKEVLNKQFFDCKKEDKEKFSEICRLIESIIQEDIVLSTLGESVDFNYLVLDSQHFIYNFNFNQDLHFFWFWMYNLQNPSRFDQIGLMSETSFYHDLFRVLFLYKFMNLKTDHLSCPIPELEIYWERYFKLFNQKLTELMNRIGTELINELYVWLYNNGLNRATEKITEGFKERDPDENPDPKTTEFGKKVKARNLVTKEIAVKKMKSEIQNSIREGNVVLFDREIHLNIDLYLNALTYAYLELIYEMNSGKVKLVRRNWEDGTPLNSFIRFEDDDVLYAVDQFGGLFFYESGKAEKYFKIKNAVIQSLWDCSLLIKKQKYFTKDTAS